MYSFFILGQIPGTSITITFTMWVQVSLLILAIFLLHRYHRRQTGTTGTLQPTIASD